MHIGIVHGFFLGDSGSAIYTRELAREFIREGHDVTLVCQEQHPLDYDFISSVQDFAPGNGSMTGVLDRETGYAGDCRLIRPHIHGYLPVYVPGPFPPFEAAPLQDTTDTLIERYIDDNVKALTAVFDSRPAVFVQANHAVLQPFLVREGLRGAAPYIATIHGSELNFTVRNDPRMGRYMAKGLEGAAAIAALSETSRNEAIGMSAGLSLDIEDKTFIVPPGVDTQLFRPADDIIKHRSRILQAVSPAIDPGLDDVAVFCGRLLHTKGLQYLIAALPLILQQRPRFQLIVVGDGPMRKPLTCLITLLESGNIDGARTLLEKEPELGAAREFGSVLPEMAADEEKIYQVTALGDLSRRIHFTGHLSHEKLAPLFAAADISLAPSVFPEAFGLVSIESLAAGAVPVATYQTGLRSPLDIIAAELGDRVIKRLKPGINLTPALAENVSHMLMSFDTRDTGFRQRLHALAEYHFSWMVVARRYIELAGA